MKTTLTLLAALLLAPLAAPAQQTPTVPTAGLVGDGTHDDTASDADEVQVSTEAMARLISGLLLRCRERVYVGISELGESGFEQRGELLKAFQKVLASSS